MKKSVIITILALAAIIAGVYFTLSSKISLLDGRVEDSNNAILELQNQLAAKDNQIKQLSEKIDVMDKNTWMYSAAYQLYHNEKYNFSIKLPAEFLKKAEIQESENEQTATVTFYYNGYVYEDGSKQPFFWVDIVPVGQKVTVNGGEELLTPFMVKNDKAYYIQTPVETGLPEKEDNEYQYYFIRHTMLREMVLVE